jgi:hypothetical protein
MALMTCSKCGKHFYGVGCPDCDYSASPADVSEGRRRPLIGALFLAVGIFIFFIKRTQFHTEWIQSVVGGMFALVGVQLIIAIKGRVSALMGALICSGFSALGFYAAFGHGPIEGGIPFIPDVWNQKIGRILFGGAACLTALMAIYFLRQAWKPSPKHDSAA